MQTKHNHSKIKVFHLVSNPSIGGIEGMLSNLIPRMNGDTCEMRIVNLRTESQAYALWDLQKIPYYKLETPGRFLMDSIRALTQLFEREQPDIVEIYGLRANLIGRIAARRAGVPAVITGVLSTDAWRRWYHTALDRFTARHVDAWIPNSRACRQSLRDREKFPDEKIHVIYDGIDVEAWTRSEKGDYRDGIRREFGVAPEHVLCTTVANLRHAKGYPFLLEAIPGILKVNENARFLFVGKGGMEAELREKCRQKQIEEYVIFAGYRSDIKDIYEGSDIALLPSLYEGLPICLIEAMSMELPVISTRVSGIPELVKEGQTGLLMEPADPEAIVEAVCRLAGDPALRKTMGRAGRRRVEKKFSIDRMKSELLELYRTILSAKHKSR